MTQFLIDDKSKSKIALTQTYVHVNVCACVRVLSAVKITMHKLSAQMRMTNTFDAAKTAYTEVRLVCRWKPRKT